ncbi:hypothetical protein C7C46_15290 [Streptomyces tateyamensis]|uniref:Uncharacterized protein n=1 Tax=Streptomyces tateyamensis TaxID=565073 RepID=A0A2V4N4Q1_9ACTN|nr:hypothetical protein [Streptomyces tateyamensis]PYC78877.1 hypothetical protein C7C46_15290 [Streptomyces tateyamensis]
MRAGTVLRAATALGGAALIGYGLYGLLHDHYITDPLDVLGWAAGGLVLHDGIWLPLVCLATVLFARLVAPRVGTLARSVLTVLAVTALALTAVALPAALRAGTPRVNATVLPLPYLRNYLLALAALAGLAVATAGWAVLARRRAGRR